MAGDLMKSELQSSQGKCRYDLLYAMGYNSDKIHSFKIRSLDCAGYMVGGNVSNANKITP